VDYVQQHDYSTTTLKCCAAGTNTKGAAKARLDNKPNLVSLCRMNAIALQRYRQQLAARNPPLATGEDVHAPTDTK
jgi:hypothetical protein